MTDAGWAERKVRKTSAKPGANADVQVQELCIRLVKQEHARSVRIVKAEIKRVKLDQHVFTAQTKGYLLEMLNHLLTALQRGRGGKG